jgi:hypothetical protein
MNWFDVIEDSKNEQESYDVLDEENKILDHEWHWARDDT